MTTIERLPVPSLPNATVRKKMPAPFSRPSITIGAAAAADRREWRVIPVGQVREGDIVPGIGRVSEVIEHIDTPAAGSGQTPQEIAAQVAWTVVVVGGLDNTRVYPGDATVWAFTARSTGSTP